MHLNTKVKIIVGYSSNCSECGELLLLTRVKTFVVSRSNYSSLQIITIVKVCIRITWRIFGSFHGTVNMDAFGVLELAQQEAEEDRTRAVRQLTLRIFEDRCNSQEKYDYQICPKIQALERIILLAAESCVR